MITDLKPHPDDISPLTPARAFTLAQLVVYRYRDAATDPAVREAATAIANSIHELEVAWRRKP